MKEDIKFVNPTQGFNVKSHSHHGIDFKIWDVGGQKAIRKFWSNYYEESEALVSNANPDLCDRCDRQNEAERVP